MVTWKVIKEVVKERYLPLDHETLKMNKFYGLTQKHFSVDAYYSKFVKLKRYAPPMTKPQAVSHFVRGLNPPLNHHLKSMRPESLQDVVLQAKPLEEEIRSSSHIRKQTPLFKTITRDFARPNHNLANPRVSQHQNFNSALQDMAWKNELCYNCFQSGHRRAQCPHPPRSVKPPRIPNPNPILPTPKGRAAMINPPTSQAARSYSKSGLFNSKGCAGGCANVVVVFGEEEVTLQDKENGRAQVYAAIKHLRQQLPILCHSSTSIL